MKITKIIALMICAVMIISSLSAFAVTSSAVTLAKLDGKYTVEEGKLTLKLKLANNPGINTLVADLGYDGTLLSLDSVTNGDVFSEANNGSMFQYNGEINPLILYFEEKGVGNIMADGTVATLVFTVIEEAEDYGFTLAVEEVNTFGSGEGIVPVDVPFAECTVVEAPDVMLGDINGDGKVNAVDANLIKRMVANSYKPNEEETAAADVNGDGKVNAVDANMIKKMVVGANGK